MTSEEIYRVVETLVGKLDPVADSAIDRNRRENLKVFIEVFDKMYTKIDEIVWDNEDSPYGSVKEIVALANKALKNIRIPKNQQIC